MPSPSTLSRPALIAAACLLVLASWLRFEGLTRGDLLEGPQALQSFHSFHPDELSVIKAAINLGNPLTPELTVYGMLPMYLFRASAEVASVVSGRSFLTVSGSEAKRRVHFLARSISAVIGCAVVLVVLLLGLRFFSELTGLIGAAIVSVAPIALQQAHFYTVDGLFLLCLAGATYGALAAFESMQRKWFALAGLLIGLTASVRLSGLLVAVVSAVYLLLMRQRLPQRSVQTLLGEWLQTRELWLTMGVAAITVMALQPYLLFNSEVLARQSLLDLNVGMQVARGEILQPWTLADLHTTPFLHHWQSLWPQSVGWPMTIVLAAGLCWGFSRWQNLYALFLALWCVVYFVPVGGLHAKHVRYLLPMLPALALLAGELVTFLWRQRRAQIRFVTVGLFTLAGVHAILYGVAFASIYAAEDSRLQASRWLSKHVPDGTRVGVERGGFSMDPVLDDGRYKKDIFKVSGLFYQVPYMLCSNRIEFFKSRLRRFDYVTIVHASRYTQFTRAPDLFPVISELYRRLLDGRLGFEVVARFQTPPTLFGFDFHQENAEASFVGFDHPTVSVLKRTDLQSFDKAFAELLSSLQKDTACRDGQLRDMALLLLQDDLPAARQAAETMLRHHPEEKLAHRIAAEIYRRQELPELASAALFLYRPENASGRTTFVRNPESLHGIPGSSALSLVDLGLHDLAVADLAREASVMTLSPGKAQQAARSYMVVAGRLFNSGFQERAEQVSRLSLDLHPMPAAYNTIARANYNAGAFEAAAQSWQESLKLDPSQVSIHRDLAVVSFHNLKNYRNTIDHLEAAIELDGTMAKQLRPTIELARSRLAREE